MQSWQLQTAKARLSDLVRDARTKGPQEITVRGEPAVVVLSRAEYDRLAGKEESLVAFIRRSPLMGLDIEFERDRSPDREIDLFGDDD
jgi:prevent-host-death family protein